VTVDAAEQELLAGSVRAMMTAASGPALDAGLAELGWPQLLAELPDVAITLVFRLLGETGAHASVLNDVLLHAAGRPAGGTVPLPFAGGRWVAWDRGAGHVETTALDTDLPLRAVPAGEPVPLAAGRRALGWWLAGTGRAMLCLARSHAMERIQFGRRLASFQAVRHRLADTLVALEGAEATLLAAEDDLGSMLAKAAAGQAALTAARHCQQVLGGIGFTAEHGLHRHVRRALVLDGLLGSAPELTREAGAMLRKECSAPRLVRL
jgi:Acyl-CoA dehydrogenase, C-terminal domain